MIKIIDKRGTGKTSRLFLLAKENNGVIVCGNPRSMREKAYCYGIVGLDFVSYEDYFLGKQEDLIGNRPIFIDELSHFLFVGDNNIKGYCESED